jgi:hypothetical protein
MMPIRLRLRRILTFALASLGLALPLHAATLGNFGENLEQAKKTEFFSWFHLEQTEAKPQDGKQVVSFKPSGRKFHHLVTVTMTTAAGERLQAVELVLLRSFIDSSPDGLFARDIAKSFLLAGLAAPRDQEAADLINEIQYRGVSGMTALRHESVKEPKLPEKPTPGYLTYSGQHPSYEHPVPGFLLRLENTTRKGVPVLVVSIRSQQGKAQ